MGYHNILDVRMPLFDKKRLVNGGSAPVPPPRNGNAAPLGNNNQYKNGNGVGSGQGYQFEAVENGLVQRSTVSKPKLVFHCQQAQGSPTGLISGFSNVKELYQKIADCYDFPIEDILFCTLNTHRIDMENLLSAQLCLDDFIFVHRKGTKKEVELTKSEDALGLTITDNGNGYAFIKRIRDGSIIDQCKAIQIGDHIERIDNENLVGWRHVEVAKYLKSIPVGKTFVIRLVEPLKAGFMNIGPKSDSKNKGNKGKSYGSGKETLRFRSNGPAQIEQAPDDLAKTAIESINRLLENFMGINDNDLATQIFEMAASKTNTMELAEAVDNSELESFGFTDDFLIDVWGIVTDAKSGRLGGKEDDDD